MILVLVEVGKSTRNVAGKIHEIWLKTLRILKIWRNIPMKNCEMKLDGNILTITVDVSKEFGKSASGKSIIIASTEGNVSIPEKEDIKIGLNIYRKA